MTKFRLTACVAVLISAGLVSQAAAEEVGVVRTATVRTSDLNLASEQGAATLLRRISAQAFDLCAVTDTPLNPRAGHEQQACTARAVARSLAGVHSPAVAAAYAHRYRAAPTEVAAR
jgi:UrcA family protein